MHPGVYRLVPAWGGSTAAVLGHLWTGRDWPGAAHGCCAHRTSCQRRGAAPASAWFPFRQPWLCPSSSAPPHIVVWLLPLLWSWSRPSLWLWAWLTVAPWWPVPKEQCQHSPETHHAPALRLASGASVTAPVAQVPRVIPSTRQVVPNTTTAGTRMPAPLPFVPTQTCSQGAQQTGLVADNSLGPGAILLASANSQSQHLQRSNSSGCIFSPEGPVGPDQGRGTGQNSAPVSPQGSAGPGDAADRGAAQ